MTLELKTSERFMRIAIEEARASLKEGNSDKLRPRSNYCEEMIILDE